MWGEMWLPPNSHNHEITAALRDMIENGGESTTPTRWVRPAIMIWFRHPTFHVHVLGSPRSAVASDFQ